jgi:hypothetical protein
MPTVNLTIQRAAEPTTSEPSRFGTEDPPDERTYRRYSPSGSGYETTVELLRIVRTEASTVQNGWQWELGYSYGELGAALSELTALDVDDEWKIDTSVYNAASRLCAPFRGDYADTRTYLSRRWYIIRFRVLHWLWCALSGVSHRPESEQPSKQR